MAMNKSTMATAIKAGMDSVSPSSYDLTTEAGVSAYRQALLEEFCDAVIKHIQSFAVVTTTVPGAGLTATDPISGALPVIGSATGTGTVA